MTPISPHSEVTCLHQLHHCGIHRWINCCCICLANANTLLVVNLPLLILITSISPVSPQTSLITRISFKSRLVTTISPQTRLITLFHPNPDVLHWFHWKEKKKNYYRNFTQIQLHQFNPNPHLLQQLHSSTYYITNYIQTQTYCTISPR